ncbi:hypothetical protein K432DRAFT_435823 [Lepidopterella palustris CBS 459.81]|uniref:Large ribosomal subunit protein mL59 domain-containing protein n=1 Tax=Lepidopterella palustris CBS 459.81 TaxID=1314670 RepID=A0A8E2E780_9PEZI|nr:hypothetical protein K432DRAFT_435823 [Lepidopterella palustris CBS 459.81]
MSTRIQQIELASALPKRLLDFFRKYPPPALTQGLSAPATPSPDQDAVASTTSLTGLNATMIESPATQPAPVAYNNPFQPTKHYRSGRWHSPVYGLRRQAEMVKLAEKHGVVSLLPYTIKLPGERAKRREERGLRVKGTGVGERVKGKLWERTLKGRLEERRQAMLDMPRLIQEWKQKGHGRGWKKWPK